MFKRKERVFLYLSDHDFRLICESILRWRNKLTAHGKCADPINELLGKLLAN